MEQVSLRRWILAASLCAVLVFGAAAIIRQPAPAPQAQLPQLQAQIEPVQEPAAAEVPPYCIALWQGRVAVFEGEEPLPVTVLDTPAASLPPADQQALERGIPVYSREELAGLIEDYGS